MKPNSLRINKAIVVMLIAIGATNFDRIFAATTITVTEVNLGVPAYYAVLDTGSIEPFKNMGSVYAGLFSGTVGDDTYYFFCADLTQSAGSGDFDIYDDIKDAPFTGLTTKQKCLLNGVYDYFGITTPDGFDSSTTQDLTGSTTNITVGTTNYVGPSTILAAQLVMWEIIHENSDPYAVDGGILNVNLDFGNLIWAGGVDSGFDTVAFSGDFKDEFADIATHAYAFCPIPEITSPVALIAGGLLFIRRREPRRSRLKMRKASTNSEITLTA